MFYNRVLHWTVISITVAILCGCDIPRPFSTSDDTRSKNPQLNLGARAQLLVTPVLGVPGLNGTRSFTDLLIAALRKRDIPALSHAPSGIVPLLIGSVSEKPGQDGTMIVTFEWRLVDTLGITTNTFSTHHTVPGLEWLEHDPFTISDLTREVSAEIDRLLSPQSALIAIEGVYIAPLNGLPGDGNTSLHRALVNALAAQNVNIVDRLDQAAFEVRFDGTVTPLPNGSDLVSLFWEVYRHHATTDPKRLGQIDLTNSVAAGRTNGPWRELASAAASGSASGIIELLVQAGAI